MCMGPCAHMVMHACACAGRAHACRCGGRAAVERASLCHGRRAPASRRLPLPPAAARAAGGSRLPRCMRRAGGTAPCTPLWRDSTTIQCHGQPVARAVAAAGRHGGTTSRRRAAAAAAARAARAAHPARGNRGQPGARGPPPPQQPRVRLGWCSAPLAARLDRCGAPRITRAQPAALHAPVAAAAAPATRDRLGRAPSQKRLESARSLALREKISYL